MSYKLTIKKWYDDSLMIKKKEKSNLKVIEFKGIKFK